MFGALAAGTYRGQIGSRVYGHDTGGSMQGRYVRHAAMGQALGQVGMHMGGMRLLSALPPLGPVGGRDVHLGDLVWRGYGPSPAYVPPVPVVRASGSGRAVHLGTGGRTVQLGTIGYRTFGPELAYADPAPVVPYTPVPSAIHWQRLNLGSARIGIMGRRRLW